MKSATWIRWENAFGAISVKVQHSSGRPQIVISKKTGPVQPGSSKARLLSENGHCSGQTVSQTTLFPWMVTAVFFFEVFNSWRSSDDDSVTVSSCEDSEVILGCDNGILAGEGEGSSDVDNDFLALGGDDKATPTSLPSKETRPSESQPKDRLRTGEGGKLLETTSHTV